MERCANSETLAKYERNMDEIEKKYERVEKLIHRNIKVIREEIYDIKSIFEDEGLEFDLDFVLESL